MLNRLQKWLIIGGISTLLFSVDAFAQFTIQHQAPTTISRNQAITLEFLAAGINRTDIEDAILFFRFDDGLGFEQAEVEYRNGLFSYDFTITNNDASIVEYYFQLTLNNGNVLYFPDSNPQTNPVRVDILEENAGSPNVSQKRISEIDYTILSPEPGDVVASDNAVIAIALFYDINAIEKGEFALFVDDTDVTSLADTSDYFISYVPKKLANGPHNIRLNYITESETYLVVQWDVSIVNPTEIGYSMFGETKSYMPIGNIELGARSQNIAGSTNDAFTARSNISGKYGIINYSLNGFFTSQESNRLQPQNRYGANVRVGKWLNVNAGHVYPSMTNFTITGRRVYGLNAELNLLKDNFNVEFVTGEMNRKVTNLYSDLLREEKVDNAGNPVDTTYTLRYKNQGKGTFSRKITAGRVAIGNQRKFQIGFHAMKVQDDTTSLFNIRDYDTLLDGPTSLYSNLSALDHQKISDNPNLLQIQNGAVKPRGNFVAGTDLHFGLAQNKIRFKSETVVSALNMNIYGGPLTVQRADELGFEIDQKDVDFLKDISRYIIINESMDVLPIRIKDISSDSAEAETFFPTSIIGSNSEFSVNYPSNNFKLQYRWVGPNFNSLANSTIRKDIAGFTATDRFRLLQNQVYVTLGYETLTDNVTGNKDATTTSNSYRTNVSWYPVSRNLPRISIGFRYRTRDNEVTRFNPFVSSANEHAAIQNFVINGVDTLSTSNPKNNTTLNLNGSITQQFELLDIVHDASLSINNLSTTDNVFTYGDVSSSALSFNLTSRFSEASLRTQLGFTVNNTTTGSGQTDIKIFGMYTGASYFMIDGKLNINGRLAITSNTSKTRSLEVDSSVQNDNNPSNDYYVLSNTVNTSDFGTFVVQAGARYDLTPQHSFIFDANFTNVSGSGNSNDSIASLRYLFNF